MLMLSVSSPPNAVPFWNDHKTKNIEAMFEIAFEYFTNDSPLLLYVHEKKGVRDDVRTFVASYDFLAHKDYWVFIELPSRSPLDTSLTIYVR
jgi:hypothetical protein